MGFLKLPATDDSLRAEFVSAGGGNFVDSFTLRRPSEPRRRLQLPSFPLRAVLRPATAP